jgi:hypothetical protein
VPLVERQRKKTKTAEESETATGTEQSATPPEVAGSSPPREAHVQFPLASTTVESSVMETDKELESGQPGGVPRDGALDGTLNL